MTLATHQPGNPDFDAAVAPLCSLRAVLVTGAGGFLGGALAKRLVDLGLKVRTLQRGEYPALAAMGCEMIRGDLQDSQAVRQAAQGVDIVFHVAAKAGVYGPEREYVAANVDGARHALDACLAGGVPSLVFTSSPSVVFSGRDEAGIDESAPYPERYLAAYPRTKAAAERMVLAANGPSLATVALRPHLIWGPGDRHLTPRVLERGRAGKLRLVGSRENLVDSTYIDNAADAHLLAAARLADARSRGEGAACAGKAYFISNGEPIPMAELINRILAAGGLPPVTRRIPAWLAYAAGAAMEAAYTMLGRKNEPPMTRFVARQLATHHHYNLAAARRDLGYVPRVTLNEGMARLAAWLRTAGAAQHE